MAKSHKSVGPKYSADRMMQNVALSLIRDFQTVLQEPCFCSEYRTIVRDGTIAEVREAAPKMNEEMTAAEYKATYQIQSIFKRYRYQTDIYSDDELTQLAISSFLETQSRIANLDLDSLDAISCEILDRAAVYIAHVLGEYDDEECRNLCQFGRKASVGIPARAANEAARWELPLTGSLEQIRWFDSEMSQVECVQNYWAAQQQSDLHRQVPVRSIYREIDSLKLSLVPKSYKALRAIMPNSTIGSYMSYGLGEIMRKRLKRKGYDIRRLQERHRYLARSGSVHGLYVTADLSSASDSISVALVHRLFPKDWVEVLDRSRIAKVELPNGQIVQSETYCTMGIGYTFPLQTLVFLSLLKAIESCFYARNDRRTISVYGDDMIYSCRMHEHVVRYFEKFGFVINIDKTYHEGNFRESCGGDYYRGVDVRPFQPRNGSAFVGPKAYEAMLYKYTNGLLARWTEHEVAETLRYLMSEIEAVAGQVKLVPGDFPDDSGVKCPTLDSWVFLRTTKVAKPKALGNGVYRFSYLSFKVRYRKEERHEPYLWQRLRGSCVPIHSYDWNTVYQSRESLLAQLEERLGIRINNSPLVWKEDYPPAYTRSKLTGRRLRRKSAYVTISHTGGYKRQSGISCFENRR